MKVVINSCYGGFSISRECAELMAKKGCKQAAAELAKDTERWFGYGYVEGYDGYDRSSHYLVEAVEELGERANNSFSELTVVEIPDDVEYHIDEYDGMEAIHEAHRVWC